MIKNYFSFKTEKTLHDITNKLIIFRIRLRRRRHHFMMKKQMIDPSPEVMIDAPNVLFKNDQIAYLSQGINK